MSREVTEAGDGRCTSEKVYLQLQLMTVQPLQVMQRLLAPAPRPVPDSHVTLSVFSLFSHWSDRLTDK